MIEIDYNISIKECVDMFMFNIMVDMIKRLVWREEENLVRIVVVLNVNILVCFLMFMLWLIFIIFLFCRVFMGVLLFVIIFFIFVKVFFGEFLRLLLVMVGNL